MDFLSQRPLYSAEPSTKGFDLTSGKIWIYPENYPLREYQFEIVQSALYHNTLVCLPTGLGKTFIAAVVMYNFWRWYPQGKIVFLAPTKPLVAQQINACHEIMGIPHSETIELTGATDQKKRRVAWQENRVIFATPQVFQKDLEKNIVPSDRVKCVVVDEAHKALGKHSYCESIRLLSEQNSYFRVLALSATPGGKLDAVQEVVRNLHITHMELRDDQSPDIIPYINARKVDIVLVGLGAELEGFKDRYIAIMDPHVRVLVENNVLHGFAGNISKGRIFHIQREWQNKAEKGGNHGKITKTLTILMTMYHAYELMVRHGLRAFCHFYQNHMDKFWLNDEPDLLSLLEEINYFLGPFPDIRPMPDGTICEIPDDVRFGHNKFHKLKEILLQHFERFEDKEEETRAIVFVEYRDIVNEVYVLLLQSRPLIRPQKFVGQAGQKQKQQKLALENFRSNKVNVLISTSVGEEGLDVGEVDLIVCFDISQQSPTRLVQRMGRTGRKRDGHIVVLVTDGKEHQTLRSTMSRRDSLNSKVLQSSGIINALHKESPRMVPPEFNPECQKMVMTVVPKTAPTKGKGKTKEPKKPRKQANDGGKSKNSKLSAPSTSQKPAGSQSLMMKFLKKSADDPQMEVDEDFVDAAIPEVPSSVVPANRATQSTQQSSKTSDAIKQSNVKLLSSDNAAVEFLTLCTMKKSEKEQTFVDRTRTNPYLPSYYTNIEKYDNFFDFEVPDMQILNCLKDITECVVPSNENENDEVALCEPTNRFNGYVDFHATPENENPEVSKFEALLDESSSDSDATGFQPKKTENFDFSMNEQVDWGENIDGLGFEGVFDAWSDESKNPNEIPCRSLNDLNEPGVFENILNDSSDGSDTDFDPRNTDVKSKTPEKTAVKESPVGAFEEILNLPSDESDTDCDLQVANVKSKTPEKTAVKKSPVGAFEEILNLSSDESDTDCDLQVTNVKSKTPDHKVTTKNPFEATTANESRGAFEDILNLSSDGSDTDFNLQDANVDCKTPEKPTRKNPIEAPINKETKGAFEDILNSSSSESETHFSPQNAIVPSKAPEVKNPTKNSAEATIANETKGAFEDILNTSSDDSETDCSLQLEPDATDKFKRTFAPKRPNELPIDSQSRDSLRSSKNSRTPHTSVDMEIDESADLLVDYKPEALSQFSAADGDRRNFKIFADSTGPSTSGTLRKSTQSQCSLLSVSQTLREVERISSEKKIHSEVNRNAQNKRGETCDERSTSPVFPDRPRGSWAARLSGSSLREPARELPLLSRDDDRLDAASEEDIFGADDLTVDSDLEAEIEIIERSAARVVDTSGREKPSVGNANEEKAESNSAIGRNCSAREAPRAEIKLRLIDERDAEATRNPRRPAGPSVAAELNLDDCDWDGGETRNPSPSTVKESAPDTVDLADCDWSIESAETLILPRAKRSSLDVVDSTADCRTVGTTKKSFSSAKESTPDTVDFADCDWDTQEAKNPAPTLVKESLPDTVDFSDCNWGNGDAKNPPVKESIPETADLDDCDWGSDFEVFDEPAKPSTSSSKTESLASPKSINNSPSNFDRIGGRIRKIDTTGWISTEKPKISLSRGSKLANIRKNLLTIRTSKKKSPPQPNPDSDSENEFAVGRLETTLTNQLESSYFAKPKPVDKATRPGSLAMSNARRIIRRPLAVRRDDVNKLSVKGLSSFAAPTKYTQQQQQQQEARKNAIVGVGRQKSSSLDLDPRNKKKQRKHRGERRTTRVRSEFIDDEAEVSTDANCSSGSSGADDDLHDFVSYTQHADDSVDMHAHYLQTLRSPPRAGGFHIRKPRSSSPGLDIYSQALPDEPNAYLYDSFCVAEDDDVFEDSETADEISLLEEIEMNLKSKKRKRRNSVDSRTSQKRRVVVARPADTSSSEDEMEKLRRQIHDESFVLRNRRE